LFGSIASMIEEFTKEKILEEVKKLQYLYKLKYEIRYGQNRGSAHGTESVAEHIYAMHVLVLYFLPLEDPEGKWDSKKIYELVTVHDFDEVETGDIIGFLKTETQYAYEAEAMRRVIETMPAHMQNTVSKLNDEYEAQETIEAKFVKAIDRFEPLIHLYNDIGRETIHRNKETIELATQHKSKYVEPFPFIKLFTNTLHEVMDKEGHYWKGD
jgi:putative hydrolase of HD superfamily